MSQGCGCGPKKEKEPCGCDKIKSSEALSAPSSTAKKCRCSSASNRSIPQQQQQYYCPQYTNQRQGQFSTSPSAASAYSNDDDRALWNTAMIVDYGGSGSSSNQRRKSALQYPKNVQYPPTTAYDNYSTGTAESEVDALSNADSQYSMETSTSVEYVYEEYTYPDPDNPDLDKQVKVYKKKSITMYPETQETQQTNSYPQKAQTAQLALTYPQQQQQATSYGKRSSSSPYSQAAYSTAKKGATAGAVLPYSGTGKTGMTGRSGGGQRASSALQSYNTGNYQQVSKKRSYTKTTTKMVYDDPTSVSSSKNYNYNNYSLPQNRQQAVLLSSYAAANAGYSVPAAPRSGGYNFNNYNYNSKRSPYAASSIPAAPPLPLAAPLTFACPSSCSMNSSPSSYDQQQPQYQNQQNYFARKVPTVKYPDDVDAYPGGGFSDYNYSDKTFTVPSFGPRPPRPPSPPLPPSASQGASSNHCPSSCSGASSRYPSASSRNYNSGASSSNYYSALSSHSSSSNNGPASYGAAAAFGGISAIRPRSPLSCSLSEDKKKGTFSPFDGRILTASGAIPPSPKDKSSCYCTALSSTKLDDSELWNKSMHESLIEEYLEEPKMPALFKEDEKSSSSAANKSGIKISACKCKSKDDTSSSTASTVLTSTEKKEKKPCCCDKKKNVKIEEETQSKSSKEKLCACSTKSSINAEKVTTIICQDKAPILDVEKEIQVQGGEEKKSPKPCCCSSKKEKAKKEEEEQQKSSYTPKNKKQEARKKRSREEEPIYTKKEIKTVQNQVASKPERSATRNRNNNNMPCGCSIKDSQSSKKSYKDASLNEQERRLYGKDLDPNAKCKKAHVECESEYLCYCDIKDARSHRRSDSETSVKKTNCCMPAKKKKKKKNVIPRDVATLEVEESYEDFDFDEEAEPNGTSTPQEIEDDNRLKQLEDEEREELLKKLTEFQKKKRKLIKKRSSH